MKTFKELHEMLEGAKDNWMSQGPASAPGGGSYRRNPKGKKVQQDSENRKWEVASWIMSGLGADLESMVRVLNSEWSYPNEVKKAVKEYEKKLKLYDAAKKRYAANDYEWIIQNAWEEDYQNYAYGTYNPLTGKWEGDGWKEREPIPPLKELGKYRLRGPI